MHAAAGILTARGGMTSHAAVVARGMGRPCVCGAGSLRIDDKAGTMTVAGETVRKGDVITIDGGKGEVLKGRVKMRQPELSGDFAKVMQLGGRGAPLGVRANADTPREAQPGARLRRRGHRAVPHRAHVLRGEPHPRHARDDLRRRRGRPPPRARQDPAHAARRLRGPVRDHGRPAGDDPPARPAAARVPAARGEGSGRRRQGARRAASRSCRRACRELHEFNPMLGFRGCRLAIRYPEITEMQARAIFEAAVSAAKKTGKPVVPEVMIPLVAYRREFDMLRAVIVKTAQAVEKETGAKLDYQIGTMIELPRAALKADEIAAGRDGRRVLLVRHQRPDADLPRPVARRCGADPRQLRASRRSSRSIRSCRSIRTASASWCASAPSAAARRAPASRSASAASTAATRPRSPSATQTGLDYVSCSPFRVPVARLAAAQAAIRAKG